MQDSDGVLQVATTFTEGVFKIHEYGIINT